MNGWLFLLILTEEDVKKSILIYFNPFIETTTWFNIHLHYVSSEFLTLKKKYGSGFEVLFGSNYVTETNSIKQIRQIDRTAEGSADDDDVRTDVDDQNFEEDGCCGFDSTGKFHQIIGNRTRVQSGRSN